MAMSEYNFRLEDIFRVMAFIGSTPKYMTKMLELFFESGFVH